MHPERSEPQLGISRDSLSAEVRPYADNLEAQVWAVFAKYSLSLEGRGQGEGAADLLSELRALDDQGKVDRADLERLSDLLDQLDYIRKTGTPSERTKRELGETLLTITVKDAVNPYREALLHGGISEGDEATLEKKDLTYNLKEVLESDIVSYRAAGLEHWAKALEAFQDTLSLTLSPRERGQGEGEPRTIIESELKDGAIPIFMPGRDIQHETTPAQYQTCFKPVSIKEGAQETTESAYLWDHLKNLITSKDPSLTANLPEQPYLLLIKPTQASDNRTTNKTLDEQKQELELINQERAQAGLPPVHSLKPLEYDALQTRFTERIATLSLSLSPRGRGQGEGALFNLTPLDRDTWTRFIDLPLSSDGNVPNGYWHPGDRRLRFGRVDAVWRLPGGGFRLAVRVEI